MYHGKHMKKTKKPAALLVSLALVLGIVVTGTIAFLATNTGPVVNTFTPTKLSVDVEEDIENGVKRNVAVKNTGDVDAYVRAMVVFSWVNEKGEVLGEAVDAGDYTIEWMPDKDGVQNGWVKSGNYYYFTKKVGSQAETDVLFTDCAPVAANVPEGYSLSVEILAQTIQADGEDEKGNKPIELAWGVDIVDGKVVPASIEQ